ncbi:hypothetical protein E9993_13935 [Labilibacter sediminis]|nr:hypothetical protein E9993_13935 [Labilibacter sediminis]
MKKLVLSLLLIASIAIQAQESEKKIKIKTYGFVGFDAFVDTRLSVTARHNHVYLYPKKPNYDKNGVDMNDRSKFDFGAGNSRLGFAISGPDAFGATTSAKIEGDFLGNGSGNDYLLRLRHAFLKLQWEKSSLLAGQTWHPFFVTENFPSTVNFVCGAPIHPLSRAPQLKYTYQPNADLSLSIIALSQGDFKNTGALEQVEMATPEMNVQLKYGSPKTFFLAATFGVKTQQPVTMDADSIYTNKNVTSLQANLSARYTFPALTIKAEGIYGGSMTNMVMIGGIARKTEGGEPINAEYTPIRTSSIWTDIHTNGKKVRFGVFGGVTHNLGTSDESTVVLIKDDEGNILIDETGYTRGSDIAYVYAIAPRVTFTSGKVKIGLEWMMTSAAYGEDIDENSKPIDTTEYTNNRITLGMRYNF